MKLVLIYIRIVTKLFCGGGGLYEGMKTGEDIIEVIKWLIIQIFVMFFICGLVGISIDTTIKIAFCSINKYLLFGFSLSYQHCKAQ